ncbi:DeoR/GlpR family DNA-binding transcription regulator [Agrobacterium tumefaciens]|uniref:DeoR/GlpR family DNA-binding transcription regulator n=1 Tax=Agrobacterium tumefaciens TaxID=358 RepID=UPI001CBE90C6|nr:DeoR/GlpR family DNA-binding transcription regulator [Agrobacterium tumefaciens]
MLAQERQAVIRTQLQTKGRVVAADLAKQFDVSEDAIRRDLRELARLGACRRVYGGALLPTPDSGDIGHRGTKKNDIKKRLASQVTSLIEDGHAILIDASSTNVVIAQELPRDKSLTVFTNAPAIALALSDHRLCRTVVLGGVFNPSKGACLGGRTIREAKGIYADLFILGACGLDLDAGITAMEAEEAEVKKCFIEQSSRLIVALTSDKLGTASPFKIANASAIEAIAVQDDVNQEILDEYRDIGIRILQNG